jgi:hypothetical protein
VVVLKRVGVGHGRSIYRGSLPNVRVTDMRGSPPGWNVSVSFGATDPVPDFDEATLRVRPGNPSVVSGDGEGVMKGHPSRTALGRDVPLFAAAMGYGRGTYEESADVELALPRQSTFHGSTITLSVSVAVL